MFSNKFSVNCFDVLFCVFMERLFENLGALK